MVLQVAQRGWLAATPPAKGLGGHDRVAIHQTQGNLRIAADLHDMGWRVSKNTVAQLLGEQNLVARRRRRRRGSTKPDKSARKAPDRLRRNFTPPAAPNVAWVGDLTEIPTDEGKLQLAAVLDLHSRRVPGFAMGIHHDAALARAALCMAIAVRGGAVAGVIFHTDQGGEYTGEIFTAACRSAGVTQSMGRAGSCFDCAAAESFFSTVEWELFRITPLATKQAARREVAWFIDWYNRVRRHSSCEMNPPIAYEAILAATAADAVDEEQAA